MVSKRLQDSRTDTLMPHVVGECACYKFDDDKMCVYPCKSISTVAFGTLHCMKMNRFFREHELPAMCNMRDLEKEGSYEED